jgi:hypothetical protein
MNSPGTEQAIAILKVESRISYTPSGLCRGGIYLYSNARGIHDIDGQQRDICGVKIARWTPRPDGDIPYSALDLPNISIT